MKKKVLILLGILALSSISFAKAKNSTTPNMEATLNNLEAQLENLQRMEDQQFAQEQAKANGAELQLKKYLAMQDEINQKIAMINEKADRSIFGKEMKQKAKEYENINKQLSSEISRLQKVIENFELLKSLR